MTETATSTTIPPIDPAGTPRVRNVTLTQDLITLTKPKIISLLLVTTIAGEARPGDQILVMSNGAFGAIHEKLLAALKAKPPA